MKDGNGIELYEARWIVIETYFGKFTDTRAIAGTGNINDACHICDALLTLNHGRPFSYKVKKVVDYYNEIFDNPIQENIFTGEKLDFTRYLKGIMAL